MEKHLQDVHIEVYERAASVEDFPLMMQQQSPRWYPELGAFLDIVQAQLPLLPHDVVRSGTAKMLSSSVLVQGAFR